MKNFKLKVGVNSIDQCKQIWFFMKSSRNCLGRFFYPYLKAFGHWSNYIHKIRYDLIILYHIFIWLYWIHKFVVVKGLGCKKCLFLIFLSFKLISSLSEVLRVLYRIGLRPVVVTCNLQIFFTAKMCLNCFFFIPRSTLINIHDLHFNWVNWEIVNFLSRW